MGVRRRRFELLCARAGLFFWCSLRTGLCLLLLMLGAVIFVRRYANLSSSLEECGPELQVFEEARIYSVVQHVPWPPPSLAPSRPSSASLQVVSCWP